MPAGIVGRQYRHAGLGPRNTRRQQPDQLQHLRPVAARHLQLDLLLGRGICAAGRVLGRSGEYYIGYDASYRSKFSSNASRSLYTDVNGYSLHNIRLGIRTHNGIDFSLWLRNAFDQDYFEQLAVTPGNTGLIAGQPGDPRTFGATLRYQF